MHALRFTLLAFLLVACTDREPAAPDLTVEPEFSATSDWQEFIVPVEWTLYVPCLNEDLHATGESYVRRHAVTTDQGTRLTMLVMELENFQLEGTSTGHIWRPVPGDHSHSARDVAATYWHLTERFVFENQTTGQVLDWSYTYQFVTNADGEVKIDNVVSEKCSLR